MFVYNLVKQINHSTGSKYTLQHYLNKHVNFLLLIVLFPLAKILTGTSFGFTNTQNHPVIVLSNTVTVSLALQAPVLFTDTFQRC